MKDLGKRELLQTRLILSVKHLSEPDILELIHSHLKIYDSVLIQIIRHEGAN